MRLNNRKKKEIEEIKWWNNTACCASRNIRCSFVSCSVVWCQRNVLGDQHLFEEQSFLVFLLKTIPVVFPGFFSYLLFFVCSFLLPFLDHSMWLFRSSFFFVLSIHFWFLIRPRIGWKDREQERKSTMLFTECSQAFSRAFETSVYSFRFLVHF